MYFVDAVNVLARRWYVVLVGLVLVAGALVAVARYVPTAYEATGQLVVLLPRDATGERTPTNPYLNAPTGLTTAASLLATDVSTPDARRAVAEAGFDAAYSVSAVPGAGPVMVVTAKGTDPADAVATRDAVVRRVESQLTFMQLSVEAPAKQLMFVVPSTMSEGADAVAGSRLRALIGVAGAGLLLTLLACFVLDRLLLARRGRPDATSDRAEADSPAGPPSTAAVDARAWGPPGVPEPTDADAHVVGGGATEGSSDDRGRAPVRVGDRVSRGAGR